jgi:hypothetical protein
MSIGQLIDRFGQLVFLVSVVLRGLLEAVEVFADAFIFRGKPEPFHGFVVWSRLAVSSLVWSLR